MTQTAVLPSALEQLTRELPALEWITDPSRLLRLSRDFAWYSPVLERQLSGKSGELAVRPHTETEIRQIAAACARLHVPITVRGSGTGNYGQCTPLDGGLILDMTGYGDFLWARGARARAQAGIRLARFDAAVHAFGQELRWLPSTFRSATLGGLFGGGFGGAGSLLYGPVGAPGNILGIRALSVEAEPQVIELRGAQALPLHHVYGTNGIVLEIEVALAPARRWLECVATFDDFDRALDFGATLARAPGLVTREVAFVAAPIANCFVQLGLPPDRHGVIFLVEENAEEAVHELLAACRGELSYRQTADEVARSHRTLIEYVWNHTTLQAFKSDRNLTNIQSAYDPHRFVEQVREMARLFAGEVMMHVEFLRTEAGELTCSGLEIIRHRDEERLQEIMQIYRDHGVMINDSHTYIVEDGKHAHDLDPRILATKRRFDPNGLLNPGKLRSWKQEKRALPTTL